MIELQAQIQVRGTFEESPRTSAESTTIPTYRHDLEHTVAELRQQLREAQLAARDTYERRGNDVKASISPVTQSLRSALSTAPLFEAKLTRGRDHAPAGILARLRHQSGALEAGGSDIETVSRAGESQPLAANGQWHLDPCLGLIYSQAPASSDDLTQIYGINAAVARRLHELGIYTFRQIMEWTPTQVEEFSRLLALGNRIHQEDWTGQARKLGRSNSSPQAA